MLRGRDLRHGPVDLHDPAPVHIVQRPVSLLLRDKRVELLPQVRDGRLRRDPDGDGVHVVILVQQPDALRSVLDRQLHLPPGVNVRVDPPVGHVLVAQGIVAVGDDLGVGVILFQHIEFKQVEHHADLRARFAELIKGRDRVLLFTGASGEGSGDHRCKQQNRRSHFCCRFGS